MCHSWERIMLPFHWVTHGKELHHLHLGLYGIELRAFIARKMPNTTCGLIYREGVTSFASRGYSCRLWLWIYITLGVTRRGTLLSLYIWHKNPPYTHCIGKIPLCRERITSFVSKVNPCTFITEIDINLIYILQGQQSENIDCQWVEYESQ